AFIERLADDARAPLDRDGPAASAEQRKEQRCRAPQVHSLPSDAIAEPASETRESIDVNPPQAPSPWRNCGAVRCETPPRATVHSRVPALGGGTIVALGPSCGGALAPRPQGGNVMRKCHWASAVPLALAM